MTPRLLLLASLALAPHAIGQSWYQLPKWDEGLAEVCLYNGKHIKYGKARNTSFDLITVREHFNPDKLVKTVPAEGKVVLNVMKCNLVRQTRTGMYEYNQMASVFVDRDSTELIKLSAVSAEWCGNSHLTLQRDGAGYALNIANYFDDLGTLQQTVAAPVLTWEQLWMVLRATPPKTGDTLQVARPLLRNKPLWQVDEVQVKRASERSITLAFPDHEETFDFNSGELRQIKRWSSSTGDYLKLRKSLFSDYWNRNQPGDERLLR